MIYRYKCDGVVFDGSMLGKSARMFGESLKEYLKAPSHIYEHSYITSYHSSVDNFTIVGRESENLTRTIKEAIVIRVNDPS